MSEEKYRKFFTDADADGDGYLTIQELTDMLRRHGCNDSDAKIKKMFDRVDTSDDNQISLEEFLVAMGVLPQEHHKIWAATLRSVFRTFDRNGDGKIDRRELELGFCELRIFAHPWELDRVFLMADKDHSGAIDYEEFIGHFFRETKRNPLAPTSISNDTQSTAAPAN